jgi:resuscitation-promoting factor RpfB
MPTGTTAEMWLQLRNCESGSNYGALSPGGLYRGAYQFSQGTWNTVAASAPSLTRLVGVDPATAAPVDQDSMAYTLYELRGKSPWPHCGAHLP